MNIGRKEVRSDVNEPGDFFSEGADLYKEVTLADQFQVSKCSDCVLNDAGEQV